MGGLHRRKPPHKTTHPLCLPVTTVAALARRSTRTPATGLQGMFALFPLAAVAVLLPNLVLLVLCVHVVLRAVGTSTFVVQDGLRVPNGARADEAVAGRVFSRSHVRGERGRGVRVGNLEGEILVVLGAPCRVLLLREKGNAPRLGAVLRALKAVVVVGKVGLVLVHAPLVPTLLLIVRGGARRRERRQRDGAGCDLVQHRTVDGRVRRGGSIRRRPGGMGVIAALVHLGPLMRARVEVLFVRLAKRVLPRRMRRHWNGNVC